MESVPLKSNTKELQASFEDLSKSIFKDKFNRLNSLVIEKKDDLKQLRTELMYFYFEIRTEIKRLNNPLVVDREIFQYYEELEELIGKTPLDWEQAFFFDTLKKELEILLNITTLTIEEIPRRNRIPYTSTVVREIINKIISFHFFK